MTGDYSAMLAGIYQKKCNPKTGRVSARLDPIATLVLADWVEENWGDNGGLRGDCWRWLAGRRAAPVQIGTATGWHFRKAGSFFAPVAGQPRTGSPRTFLPIGLWIVRGDGYYQLRPVSHSQPEHSAAWAVDSIVAAVAHASRYSVKIVPYLDDLRNLMMIGAVPGWHIKHPSANLFSDVEGATK